MASELLATDALFGRVSRVAISGDRLWVGDFAGDPFLHVLDRNSGTRLKALVRRGEGPGEMQSLLGMFPSQDGRGNLWVFDGNNGRLTYLSVDAVDVHAVPIRQIVEPPLFGRLIARTGRGFLAFVSDTTARWVAVDSVARVENQVPATLLGGDSIPNRARMTSSAMVRVCSNPTGTLTAVTFYNAGRIELRGSDGSLRTVAKVPFPSSGEWKVSSRTGKLTWTRSITYYGDCAGTDRALVAVFPGKRDTPLSDGARPPGGDSGSRLHVFDWDGNFRGVLLLDVEVTGIALTTDGDTLYAASSESSSVFRVPLRGSLRDLLDGTER